LAADVAEMERMIAEHTVSSRFMDPSENHHSSLAPIRARRGGTMLSGRRKDRDDQLVFCSLLRYRFSFP
jgi:hypothetical protein